MLPLPHDLGAALADYLRRGRPPTRARQVLVPRRQRVGAPISDSIVGRAADHARYGMRRWMRRGLGYRSAVQERFLRSFAGFLDRAGRHGPIPLAASVD
jgi:hypothetical protein